MRKKKEYYWNNNLEMEKLFSENKELKNCQKLIFVE